MDGPIYSGASFGIRWVVEIHKSKLQAIKGKLLLKSRDNNKMHVPLSVGLNGCNQKGRQMGNVISIKYASE